MSIKQAQRIAKSTLQSLQEHIWKEIASKAISKMPKFQLTNQSNKVFHDFALMNGHDPKNFLYNMSQEDEKIDTIYDNLLIGGLKKSSCKRMLSQSDAPSLEKTRKISFNLNKKGYSHSKTFTQDFYNKKQTQKPCVKLFLSQVSNQQQIVDGQLRKAKQENLRYNKRLQQITRERISKSEQHALNQKKKFKEIKSFTYDYEGKLLGTKIKSNGNIKFVHIKSKFYQNMTKEHKKLLDKLANSKYSEVTDKKVINADERHNFQLSLEDKYHKNAYPSIQNSISNIFREERNIEMGVSIFDPSSNSKLFNNNHENALGKSLKISDFKKSFKSSSMMGRKKAEKLISIDPSTPKINQKDMARIKTVSDAESKVLSSAFSRYSKEIGKININNSKFFIESFQNEKL